MDDRRIEQALRQGPPDEPEFEASIATELASMNRDGAREASHGGLIRRTRLAPQVRLAGLVAAVVVLAAVALAVRPGTVPGPGSSGSPDMLARLRAEGVARIAVTDRHPQTTSAGGAVVGFDVDVAREVALALGLRDELVVLPASGILEGGGSWDLGLPSLAVPAADGLAVGPAYYAWPSWLVVDAEAPAVDSPLQLVGRTICAVSGTESLAVLRRTPTVGTGKIELLPLDVTVLERESDAACIAALQDGDAAAALTGELLDDEFASRGIRALVESPAVTARRVFIVRGGGADIESLAAALDAAVANRLESGRFSELSRGAFGGRDLTVTEP